jgi:hypothetical protein
MSFPSRLLAIFFALNSYTAVRNQNIVQRIGFKSDSLSVVRDPPEPIGKVCQKAEQSHSFESLSRNVTFVITT